MEEDVKVCPECDGEYYAHITECRGCGVPLVFPGEAAAKKITANDDSPLVCIEEGSQERLNELSGALLAVGIEPKILRADAGGSCGGGGVGLYVPQSVARDATSALDDYWLNKHPELKEMEERMSQGICPACGAKLAISTTAGVVKNCHDCGLNFTPGHGDDDCDSGSCSTC